MTQPAQATLRVAVVDDHPVVCKGLVDCLSSIGEMHVVWEAHSADDALTRLRTKPPTVAVLDLMLNGKKCIHLVKAFRSHHCKVVVFSMEDSEALRHECLRAGASAYVHKSSDVAELIEAINRSAGAASREIDDISNYRLTEKQRLILRGLCDGATPQQLAHALNISPSTVYTQSERMRSKLRVNSTAELIAKATKLKLVLPRD